MKLKLKLILALVLVAALLAFTAATTLAYEPKYLKQQPCDHINQGALEVARPIACPVF